MRARHASLSTLSSRATCIGTTSEAPDAHLRGRSAGPGEHCRCIGKTRRKEELRRVERWQPSLIAAGNAVSFRPHVMSLSHIASHRIVSFQSPPPISRKADTSNPTRNRSGPQRDTRGGRQAPSTQRGQRAMDPTVADIDIDIDIPSGLSGVGGPTAAEGESPASPSASPAPPGQRTPA
jgi:hypothetical protein